MCQLDPGDNNCMRSVKTWYMIFSCVDVIILSRSCSRLFKFVSWLMVRVVAFGVYTLFFSPTTFLQVYFGALWMSQVLMVRQLL
jgi:hypothetical protein